MIIIFLIIINNFKKDIMNFRKMNNNDLNKKINQKKHLIKVLTKLILIF